MKAMTLSCLLLLTNPLIHVAGDAPARIGRGKQLLVDDFLIADRKGVTRELGTPTRANAGKPIFTEGFFYGTVLHDQGKFRMWWRKPGQGGYGVAESEDGYHFKKVADLEGINFAGDYTLAVMRDPNETDPAHRYKAAYDAPGMAAGLAHSADGVRWTLYNQGKPVTSRAADTYNQLLWDEGAKVYRLLTRTDFGPGGGSDEWRGTRTMTNPDVKKNPTAWKTVRSWVFDREGKEERQRRQIYALTHWIYHGVHFALMTVYDWPGDVSEGPANVNKRHERDVLNCYLATCRDGVSWDLQWVYAGKPILPRGPDGAFDQDLILPASTIVTHQDKHWLYYAGGNERHGTEKVSFPRKHAIGLATLRLDSFIYLEAQHAGTVTTKPFVLQGTRLQVNVAAPEGKMTLEILDAKGAPIAGYAHGDAEVGKRIDDLRWRPRWRDRSGVAALKGQTVRLRFHLEKARLYSWSVE